MNNLGNMFSNKKTEEADINDPEEVDNVATDDDEVDDVSNDEVDDDIDTDDEIASVNSNISNIDADETESVQGVEETKGEDPEVNNISNIVSGYLSSDESDDDEEDDDYLQKFDDELRTNFINKHHPEVSVHNYEEVKKLAIVVRDGNGTIIDQLHRTIPIMTKYESTRILGQRAKQIENGAQPLVPMSDNIIDSYIIAENELKEKKIPFIIRRPIPNGGSEYWYAYDLELLH
jgi:DNA-directed RNA polymerase I, II, and III subunit RPABC2